MISLNELTAKEVKDIRDIKEGNKYDAFSCAKCRQIDPIIKRNYTDKTDEELWELVKKDRGCPDLPNPHASTPHEVDGILVSVCPVKDHLHLNYQYNELFALQYFYNHNLLPSAGGVYDQTSKFVEAMIYMENLDIEIENKRVEESRRR